jgi:phage terminase Nu1 subunit (DNA packaging protein)
MLIIGSSRLRLEPTFELPQRRVELKKASGETGMRYSSEYDEWAETAAGRGSPSDKERAGLTAARIRDNHSGSDQDRRELARMESIAGGSHDDDDDDDWSPLGKNLQSANKKPEKALARKSAPPKLNNRDLDKLAKQCLELGKEAAEADWEEDDLLDEPTPGTGDPTMYSYSVMYPSDYRTLLQSWRDGYREQAAQFRLEGPDGVSSGP